MNRESYSSHGEERGVGREERRDAERMKKSGVGERREGVCVEKKKKKKKKKKKVVMMEEEMEEEECGYQLGRRVSTHERGEREGQREGEMVWKECGGGRR